MGWLKDDAHEAPIKGKKRCASLADLLVDYSTSVRHNEIVVIETFDVPKMMIEQLITHVGQQGRRVQATRTGGLESRRELAVSAV